MSNTGPTHRLSPEEIADIGARMDRAARAAAADAIRRHRAANVPMAIWENERVRLVSPFDLPLPEDSMPIDADQTSRHAEGTDA